MKFEELDLSDNVLDSLYDMNFETCTPVQEHCIPEILNGRDLLGVAQTGTGKTAAYLLPILSKLDNGGYPKDAVNCIIMSPTRELAQQIDQAMQGFSYYLPDVSSVAVYGGNDGNRYDQEMKAMRQGADVIIATPGRLISHISMGNIDLGKVSFFVLDEADRMLDMGFSEDIMKIASFLPETRQTIMYSATMPGDIKKMAQKLLKDPVEVMLAVSKPAEKIKQCAYICYTTQKLQIIKHIFKQGDLQRVIIFSGSKQKVKQINQALHQMKINSGEMHSDLDQAQRDEMMFRFKSGQIDVLVATDILARGIDIDDIAMVINFDVPRDCEDYVHRIGRTARADRDGVAITLVNEDDMYSFRQIEKFLEKDIEKIPNPDEVGEAPEYVKNAKRSSAKDRRRKDRDETSHKKAKSRNRAKDEQHPRNNPRPKNEGEESKPAEAAQQPEKQPETTENTPQGADSQTAADAQQGEGAKKRNKRRNRKRGNQPVEDNGGQDNGQPAGGDSKSGEQPNESKRSNNRRRNKPQGEQQEPEQESFYAFESDDKPSTSEPRKKNNRRRGGNRGGGEKASGNDNGQVKNGGNNKPKGGQTENPQADRQRNNRRNNNRSNRNNNRQNNRSNGKAQGQGSDAAAKTTQQPAAQQQSGLKEIIRRPLKWLKIIK